MDGNWFVVIYFFVIGSNVIGNGCLWLVSDGVDVVVGNVYVWFFWCIGCGVDSGI